MDAPEHTQRLDRACSFDLAHVSRFPAELIQDCRNGFLATSSLPQINMVGFPPEKCGFTMCALPTELKALTNFTAGNSRCRRSIEDSSSVVVNLSTPFTGATLALGVHDL